MFGWFEEGNIIWKKKNDIPLSLGAHQYDPKDGWESYVVSRFFVVNSHMKLEKYFKHDI